ncbi:MAG TPA: aminotransferase class I/II-fold pyridoxal phosphate-dependent enzyme [Micromonosporaceae bacterium]|nr:aminotransferase class I/II-fold pyridoxal phosphate-dependent enzyme [Micromonosporaceae bacterium]
MLDEVAARLTEATARGLAAAVSRAIGEGALTPGDRLPPIRTVAARLGLSPTTVSSAWQLLARSGAIRTDGRRGTLVAQSRGNGPRRYRSALRHHASFPLDLATGVPDPALLPALGPALRRLPAIAPSSYLDEPVLPELEARLRETWPWNAERVTVLDGAMDAIDHLASSLLRLGDRVVVENPSFPPLLDLLDTLGVEAVGVPLDAAGMIPSALHQALRSQPVAIIVQPRAQNPTGAAWSAQRTRDLAAVLDEAPSVIVLEDDSAGDISSASLHSLGALLPERTIHIRSFSKSHGPDLRIAAVGGPAAILDPVLERRLVGQAWTSRLLQHLLLNLLTDPAAVTQVARARREYARRRRAVCAGLEQQGVRVDEGDGINLWLPVADEQAALISLASVGIGAAGGSAFLTNDLGAHLRVTVGLVTSDHTGVAAALAEAAHAGTRQIIR